MKINMDAITFKNQTGEVEKKLMEPTDHAIIKEVTTTAEVVRPFLPVITGKNTRIRRFRGWR